MPSKSKSKGNAFERDIRDLLNSVFECEEFARTPSSGAIMGRSNYDKNKNLNEHTKATLGSDIICPPWFKFSIECKSYKDSPNYATILKADDSTLDHWLGEALFDARNLKLTPMVCFKTTRKGSHVALPHHFNHILFNACSHVLKYNEFAIIGIDQFERLIPALNSINNEEETFTAIQTWMSESHYVQRLIDNL